MQHISEGNQGLEAFIKTSSMHISMSKLLSMPPLEARGNKGMTTK